LDKVENGILRGYSIASGNPSDQQQWMKNEVQSASRTEVPPPNLGFF
jgi:hypothetical protein